MERKKINASMHDEDDEDDEIETDGGNKSMENQTQKNMETDIGKTKFIFSDAMNHDWVSFWCNKWNRFRVLTQADLSHTSINDTKLLHFARNVPSLKILNLACCASLVISKKKYQKKKTTFKTSIICFLSVF